MAEIGKGVSLVTQPLKGAERRQWARLPVAIPVFVRGVDEAGKDFLEFTSILNIGAGGALLALRRYVPLSTEVFLEIPSAPMPPSGESPPFVRKVPARVVRITQLERSKLCGLEFNSPLV